MNFPSLTPVLHWSMEKKKSFKLDSFLPVFVAFADRYFKFCNTEKKIFYYHPKSDALDHLNSSATDLALRHFYFYGKSGLAQRVQGGCNPVICRVAIWSRLGFTIHIFFFFFFFFPGHDRLSEPACVRLINLVDPVNEPTRPRQATHPPTEPTHLKTFRVF